MRKAIVLLTMLIVIFIVACSKDEVVEVQEQPQDEVEVEVEEEEEKNIYPFTGMETTEEVTNRAVAVMVNNHPQARPQSGLSKADIVFEILAEGDITRFLAIYQSEEPEVVGPVRSAREYYFTLANDYNAIYVYHGAANFINDMIKSREIENLNGAIYDNDGHLFVREPFRKAPHNSYLQFDAVAEVAADKEYDLAVAYDAYTFLADNEEVNGENASSVKIKYGGNSIVTFEYDESTKKYFHYRNNDQTVELDSEKPIEIDNVLIVETKHEVIDAELRRAIDIHSGGPAYLLQHGKVQNVEWENRDGRIIPVIDGEVIPFIPGKTWINFVEPSTVEVVNEEI